VKCSSIVLFAVAALLAVWAVAFPERSQAPVGPAFTAPDIDLGDWPIGEANLFLKVTNASDLPGQLIGMEESCAKNCCWKSELSGPMIIGPGETLAFECRFRAIQSGPFEGRIPLHLYQNGLQRIEVVIHGNGAKSKDAPSQASR
jgi:hypothetical protein